LPGTSTSQVAGIILLAELGMAAALTVGMFLARAGKYRAHGRMQSTVLLLNLVVIGSVMAPSFRRQVFAHLSSGGRDAYYTVPIIHAAFGTVVELLGLYVLLVAGTNVVPMSLRFRNYKVWMRTTLTLWWAVVAFGAGVYYVWYVQPSAAAAPGSQPAAQSGTVAISLKNFEFTPKSVTVPVGTTVDWVDQGGHHAISADDKSFEGPEMSAGAHFQQKFDKAGVFNYYCRIHGGPGGQDMAGVLTVK
jgi:plastocyanin